MKHILSGTGALALHQDLPFIPLHFHTGIFSNICLSFYVPNFPIMIDSAQIAWLLKSITYGLPCPFSRVRFEENTYASFPSALCQGFQFKKFL
jgi:hypothetical protein